MRDDEERTLWSCLCACLPSRVKRGGASSDAGGSSRRKGRAWRRSPTPPTQPRPPTLVLPPMAERIADITASTPVQRNCSSHHLLAAQPTTPVIPSAPSPGHLFYNSEDRSDLHFLVGREGWRFPAHSFVIGRDRSTLSALIGHAHREARTSEEENAPIVLRLPDIEPEVFEQILRYIYTGQISLSTVESTLRLLPPCRIFHLPQLARRCLSHLSVSLDPNNVLIILSHLVCPTDNCSDRCPCPPLAGGQNVLMQPEASQVDSGDRVTPVVCDTSVKLPTHHVHNDLFLSHSASCDGSNIGGNDSGDGCAHASSSLDNLTTPQFTENGTLVKSNSLNVPTDKEKFRCVSSTVEYPSRLVQTICVPKSSVEQVSISDRRHEVNICSRNSSVNRVHLSETIFSNSEEDSPRGVGGDRLSAECTSICARHRPTSDDTCYHDNERNELLLQCFRLVDMRADLVLSSETFETLDHCLLLDIVRRDTLGVSSEARVFDALMRWACRTCKRTRRELTPDNKRQVLGPALFMVRYLTMTLEEFLRGPVSQGVLSGEDKELFISRLTSRGHDPLPERWRGSDVCVPRQKVGSLMSPDRPSAMTDTSVSPSDSRQPVGSDTKKKKKSMSKKFLNGVGDLVICVIQLLD